MFLTFLLFIFYLFGFKGYKEEFCWMDRNYTTAIKGLSILLIVWAHSGAMLYIDGIQFIAGIGVTLFLICSGYGLKNSCQKNGLREFWKKRFWGVCVPFWIIEFFGLLNSGRFSIRDYFLDAIFIKSATSYGWFMGYIVICYLIFYIVERFIETDKLKILILFSVFLIWFLLESLFFANPNMPFLRARQMLSFPIGVILAMKKEKIEKKLNKKYIDFLFVCVGGGGMCFLHDNNTIA